MTGVTGSFCVKKGILSKDDPVCLRDATGKKRRAQFWPLAFWPDGSIKWMGLAFVMCKGDRVRRFLIAGEAPAVGQDGMRVTKRSGYVYVDTGTIRCRIPLRGRGFVDQLAVRSKGKWLNKLPGTRSAGLFARRTRYSGSGERTNRVDDLFVGRVRRVKVEQKGPVRAVVKIDGTHERGKESFLPFSIRLYFYAGCNSIGIVHTFFYDGDSKRDFVSGLGIDFPVKLQAPPHNRHVFLALDNELLHEPVNILPFLFPRARFEPAIRNPEYDAQFAFRYVKKGKGGDATPVWNEYGLFQDSCDHFVIDKAVAADFGRVTAKQGLRSGGWAGIDCPDGGLAVGIKDFWQSCPSAISIRDAGGSDGPVVLSTELWPFRAEPLDLRHYSDEVHGPNYESMIGYTHRGKKSLTLEKIGLSRFAGDPYGIGRTSELTFHVLDGGETEKVLRGQMALACEPPVLACPTKTYESAGLFSPWTMPSRQRLFGPLERRLEEIIDYVVSQVEENRWYGFIDYGDFQIQLDEVRGNWKYDEGGRAWINEELMPGIFLWQAFLRTGRLDIYRRAEAMSRHAEVDMFHIGPLRGIGTRHNVKHWGCGNHEIRQSMAGSKRYFHLISGDERTRDIILQECPDVGKAWVFMRNALRKKPRNRGSEESATGSSATSEIGKNEVIGTLGPHLSSFFWNWLSAWEFTGSKKHRDIVVKGMEYMATRNQPYGLAGRSMSYRINFRTGKITLVPHLGKPPMANIFGSTEIWLELSRLLGVKAWDEALCKYGELHLVDTYEERSALAPESTGQGSGIENRKVCPGGTDLIAFAGAYRRDRRIMRKAVRKLLTGKERESVELSIDNRHFARWGREAIAVIALVGKRL